MDLATGRVPSALPHDLDLYQDFLGRVRVKRPAHWCIEERVCTRVGDVCRQGVLLVEVEKRPDGGNPVGAGLRMLSPCRNCSHNRETPRITSIRCDSK